MKRHGFYDPADLVAAFPWVADFRDDAAHEFAENLCAHVKSGNLTKFLHDITEWRATAGVHADPEAYAALTAPFNPDDFVDAERPEMES